MAGCLGDGKDHYSLIVIVVCVRDGGMVLCVDVL